MPEDPESFPFFLMGNKCDLEDDRQVTEQMINRFISDNPNVLYLETSAKNGQNVDEMFDTVATNFLELKAENALKDMNDGVRNSTRFDLRRGSAASMRNKVRQ